MLVIPKCDFLGSLKLIPFAESLSITSGKLSVKKLTTAVVGDKWVDVLKSIPPTPDWKTLSAAWSTEVFRLKIVL